MMDARPPIPIAYVGGTPRSGSTVLSHLIAETFNGVVVGELKHVWHRGPLANQRCSCGCPFRSCDFWVEVGREAFGGWDELPLERLIAVQKRIDRFRTLPMLLVPALLQHSDPAFDGEMSEYRETLAALYRALQAISGQTLVVDSSKHPAQAFVLSATPMFDPRVIHLVRDSRGVAWSLQKRVVRPEITNHRRLMPQATPARTSLHWTMMNAPLHLLWARGTPRLLVRYESYASQPVQELQRIGDFLGRSSTATVPPLGEPTLDFRAMHTLGGNPVRFNEMPLEVRIDEEWRTAMSKQDRLRVAALTLPLLAVYGYLRREVAASERANPHGAR
jgi:hypothetical protein